jgi:hypothetical protein
MHLEQRLAVERQLLRCTKPGQHNMLRGRTHTLVITGREQVYIPFLRNRLTSPLSLSSKPLIFSASSWTIRVHSAVGFWGINACGTYLSQLWGTEKFAPLSALHRRSLTFHGGGSQSRQAYVRTSSKPWCSARLESHQ